MCAFDVRTQPANEMHKHNVYVQTDKIEKKSVAKIASMSKRRIKLKESCYVNPMLKYNIM